MLGQSELERALLEQTYDGVMTVTGTSKQEVGGETVVTGRGAAGLSRVHCRFGHTPDSRTDAANSGVAIRSHDLLAPG